MDLTRICLGDRRKLLRIGGILKMQKHLVQPTNLPVLCWVRGGRGRGGGRGRRHHWLSSKELHLSHASAIPEQKTFVNIKPF